MVENIDNKIIIRIKKAKRGTLFFSDNFASFGSAETVRRTLSRLVESQRHKKFHKIQWLAGG